MDTPTVDVPKWNADNLCRACIEELNTLKDGEAGAYVNIFEVPELLNKLTACVSNEFGAANKYSKYLCIGCYQNVNAFYEFRRMCLESMQHFDKLHTADLLTCEEAKPFPIACETVVKEEYTPTFQVLIFDNPNESATSLEENVDYLQNDNENTNTEIRSTRAVSKRKNTNKNARKSHKKRALDTVENTPITVDHLESVATTKNERILDDDMELKDDDNLDELSSLNECSDASESVSSGYKCRTKKKLKSTKPNASKTTKSKTKNATIYQCEICPSRFLVEHRLIAHNREHKGLKPYPCTREDCNKSFTRLGELTRHLNQHENVASIDFACDQDGCDKVYKYKTTLNLHKRKIHKMGPDLKSHICEICGKVSQSSTMLREHYYTHKDKSERPYVCDQPNCTRRFANKDKLKVHLKRHAGIKNYVCSICGMRKTTRNELTIHMNYHTLERTWPCRFCKKVCNSAGNLKTHVRTVHERVKEYACRHCDLKFAKPDTRKYHEMRHTGEKPNVCSECGKGFIQPAALRTHMKVHERQQERSGLADNLSNSNQLMPTENEPKINKNG